MMKTWKKSMATWCVVALLMTMPGMYVLADEMAEEELIVTEAEVPEEIVDSVDPPVEDVTYDVDAPITEEKIDEEEAEEIVGEGPIQVGDGVTATFDVDTGDVEFISQDGELWRDWVNELGVGRDEIKSIKVASGTVYLPDDSTALFEGCDNLISLDLNNFDTSNVTNMTKMFSFCCSLTDLDLSSFDTSNVTDMSYMFYYCDNLSSLNLSNFDTSNVTDMSYMLSSCVNLSSLDLSNLDTSNVTSMSSLFGYCSSLISLDLSRLNTSNVTDMSHMFFSCVSLTSLDLSGFNTSKVTNMISMFENCSSLQSLDLNSFYAPNVELISDMFRGCSSLTSLNLVNLDTSSVTNMACMFYECSSLASLDLSCFDTSKVTDMFYMFYGCSSLISLDLSGFNTSHVADMRGIFCGCSSLTDLDLSNFDTSKVTDMNSMFGGCSNLTNLDLSSFDTTNVVYMEEMFYGCNSLRYLDLSGFDMSKITYYEYNFLNNCQNLQILITPKKTSDYLDLPFHMYDSAGNEYIYIPVLSKSILLARTTELARGKCGTIYTSGENYGNLTNEIHLTQPLERCVLKNASTEYNPELAYYLAALCRSAYGLAKDNKTFEEQTINIKKSLRSLGFDIDTDFVCDYRDDYTPAYTIAKKPLSGDSSLVLITIRGSYNLDWANNAALGPISMLGFGKHYGFEEGAEQIYNMLKRFLGKISSNNVYVITGHSQGGGVGNLLAVKLYDNQVPISNVYNYNFSAPNVACLINPQDWNANGIHDNIFNIALDYDPVSFFPCNSIPVFDVNPLATWGKFGRSFWYVPNQDDMNLIGHDLKEIVYLLSHEYPLSRFSDYNGFLAGHIKRILGIHCPVDAVVYDESGKPVAGVINNQAEYYDSEFGDVLIIIDEDEKWICLPNDKDYDVRLSATDSGEMKYEVFDVDLAKDNIISSVKAFEHVALASGKEMYSEVDAEDDVSETTLYVLNQDEGVEAEIGEDGSEQAAAVLVNDIILQNDTIDLKVGDAVQLSAEIRPKYATNKTIKWTSSNRKVVTVDDQGRITAVGTGQAVIEASSVDGGVKASVQVVSTFPKISDCSIALSKSSYTYNGSARKPTVTVKDGESVLTSGTDYTVAYSNNTNAGTATVTVTGKGNYIGTASKTFKINKAAATLAFADASISKKTTDAAFTNALTKTTDGTVTFKSSNTTVATVNSTSGQVTIKGIGSTTISANAAEGTNYKAGSSSYTLTVEASAPTPAVTGFSDVQNPTHPYYKAIYWAAGEGITKGYSDGTFGINRSCTRGEMMMFLWRYAGKPASKTVSKSPFKDVPKTHTFYKAILWGSQKGITKGYPDGTFGVNRNVSRGECMMFLWRLKGKPAPKAVAKAPFPDVPKSHVFYNAVLWGYQKKITTGFTSGDLKGKFGVNENCSRGQIVTFLYRAK